MEQRRFLNHTQPETLQTATMLLYLRAAFALLFGGLASVIGLLFVAAYAVSGYGIANEKRAGYFLGLVMAAFLVVSGVLSLLNLVSFGAFGAGTGATLLNLLFDGALLGLLLHGRSWEYVRIWFN